MKIFFVLCISIAAAIVLFLIIPKSMYENMPEKSDKRVRFDSDVKVGTIYGDKMDRFNPDLKSLFEKNIKEAALVGGSRNLAHMTMINV